jgi:hypothetical protein
MVVIAFLYSKVALPDRLNPAAALLCNLAISRVASGRPQMLSCVAASISDYDRLSF